MSVWRRGRGRRLGRRVVAATSISIYPVVVVVFFFLLTSVEPHHHSVASFVLLSLSVAFLSGIFYVDHCRGKVYILEEFFLYLKIFL